MTVIYLDGVFLLNALMDYLILLLTARLAGIPLRRYRYLTAALVGGLYAVAACWPGWNFLRGGAAKLLTGALLSLISFYGETCLLRLILLMPAIACGLAGCVLGLGMLGGNQILLQGNRLILVLGISAAAGYGCWGMIFHSAGRNGLQGNLLPVKVCLCGRTAELTALWDSGNSLREVESQQPVLVAAPDALRRLLSVEIRRLLTEEQLKSPADLLEAMALCAPSLFPQLMPFQSVGTSGGMLLAIRSDWVEVCGERMERAYVALSPTALGTEYGALWGGAVKKGGHHARLESAETSF